ncbi:hypothetical protein SA87_03515 [Hydrogenibacillus schlegelii]|uniref:Uncharacterized protein n=1 Tax=Hydrogenibacillus schlegelii TaxID=1484 RepID=A0A179IQ49_HYDSH|nr:hypothetical protein SA87_03515 [Hydrogenibacillus schlegelii]
MGFGGRPSAYFSARNRRPRGKAARPLLRPGFRSDGRGRIRPFGGPPRAGSSLLIRPLRRTYSPDRPAY